MKSFLDQHFGPSWTAKKIMGDSGERQYHRVSIKDKTCILASYPPNTQKSFKSFVSVQDLFKRKDFSVPSILAQDNHNGFVLLEDLGSVSLEQFYLESHVLDFHKMALDCLWSLQEDVSSDDLKTSFSVNQGLHEMIFTYQQFNHAFLEDDKKKLFEEFRDINEKIVQPPLVPSHRDFHSRNLFIYKDQVYIIDFQDAGFYPVYYDLVSLIEDPYSALSDEEKQLLIKYYEKKWNKSVDMYKFQLTTIQRLFKATGSFMSFFHLRGQNNHLKYIHSSLKKVESILVQWNEYPYFLKYVQLLLSRL
ncbi:MAG: phosphotransferase [Bdellovibrionales bacterium]|nr:phosphotransferase [Bdellovibrionales bacterium]